MNIRITHLYVYCNNIIPYQLDGESFSEENFQVLRYRCYVNNEHFHIMLLPRGLQGHLREDRPSTFTFQFFSK